MAVLEKLIKIQSTLKAPKAQFNKFGNYNYRNCEDILEALKPLLKEHGLAVIISDDVVNIDARYYIKATVTLYDTEDSSIVSNTAFAREEENKKGMDGSQVTGAASSYARKYALNGLFGIDDTKDSDVTNDGSSKQESGNKPTSNSGKLSDKQIARMYAIAKSKGYNEVLVNTKIYKKYKKKPPELTKGEYDEICSGFEGLKND
ncbi:MAG: ERF family protein [Anaerotignaceae bacterium]